MITKEEDRKNIAERLRTIADKIEGGADFSLFSEDYQFTEYYDNGLIPELRHTGWVTTKLTWFNRHADASMNKLAGVMNNGEG